MPTIVIFFQKSRLTHPFRLPRPLQVPQPRFDQLQEPVYAASGVDMNIPEDFPSPIRGDFIPVSEPIGRSSSPQRQQTDLGLHLHLNLTDAQMEKLASAYVDHCLAASLPLHRQHAVTDSLFYSLPGHHSPQRSQRRHHGSDVTETIQIGITPADTTATTSQDARGRYESSRSRYARSARSVQREYNADGSMESRGRSSRSRSPNKRCVSPDKVPPVPRSLTVGSTLSDRRHKTRPGAIDVDSARQYGSASAITVVVEEQSRQQHQPKHAATQPATPPLRRTPKFVSPEATEYGEDDSSSYYSEDDFGQAHPSYVSPLRVRKPVDSNTSPLASYRNWGRSPSPRRIAQGGPLDARSPQRHALHSTAVTRDLHQDDPPRTPRNYSPLSDYLSNRMEPVRKNMVGKNGWLERTTHDPDKKAVHVSRDKENPQQQDWQQQKKRGFLNSLKKIAKDMTSSATAITSSASRKPRDKEQRASHLSVSLDPREQSLLYCELEFLLTTALGGYISSQFHAGRLDADKYKKVVDGWQARGRPKVIGFRYDLETQLDLIMLHGEDFRFYGKRAGMPAAVNGVLDMMRVDSRAMRIRTFCQPDTVIAKQLLDAQSLFNLIGCCEQQQIQLAEVIQFFKVILEREQNYHRGRAVGQQSAHDGQHGRGSGGTSTGCQPKEAHTTENSVSPPENVRVGGNGTL